MPQRKQKSDDIVVFEVLRDSTCAECGESLGKGEWLRLERERPLCLSCADLGRLVFLPSGDTALTRRAVRYPGCPESESVAIAEHACRKYSGRVGRSAEAKRFDAEAIALAVNAHVRHVHSKYDQLLNTGWDRLEARAQVRPVVEQVLATWSGTKLEERS